MSYLKPNLSGVYDIPSLNASSQLYIRGKPFEQYINELVFEDQLEQGEIDEIKLLLQYLNTSGLSSEWIVDNNNKNQDLKTAITALQTKLANITTTSLTQNSNLTDDNRNSVLKSRTDTLDASMNALTGRVDGNDSSIGTLNGKTQYITSSVGDNNANPKTYSQHAVVVSNAAQRKRILLSPYPSLQGVFNIILQNDESQGHEVNTDPWALINRIDIKNLYGNIEIEGRKIHIQGKVEIGDFGDATTDRRPINIGGSMARINIGSELTPKTGTGAGDPDTNDSTIITIGKLGTLKNTWTYLRGNVYTSDARFESLNATDVITWQTAASWAAGFVFSGVPYFLAWIGLSGVPNYRYSDVVKMANNYLTGGLTKNKAIETSNDLAISKLSVIDTSVVSLNTAFDALLGRLCFQAFTIHGSHSIGSIIGKSNIYAGSGEVELRVDGGVFDWAFKNSGNTNRVLLTNTDVEVVQCNGTGGTGRLKLVAGNGNIDFETANNGVRSNTTKVMEIKANKQIVIGSNSAMVDDTYKVLVDATTHTNGIKVAKNSDALLLNPTNVSSKSLTLQSGYTGTTAKTLYLDGTDNLRFAGNLVTPVKDIIAGAHVSVTSNDGVYTIAGTGGGGGLAAAGEDLVISATAPQLPRKSNWYGQRFLQYPPFTRQFYDVFMSASGKYIFWANRSSTGTATTILYSNTYFNDGFLYEGRDMNSNNLEKLWITICGTTEGSRVWAVGSNQIWTAETSMGFFGFTQATTPPNFAGATPVQIRCNGDGEYLLITDGRANSFGKIYKSNDYAATWTEQNITTLNTVAIGCAINASGKTQYVVCDGTNNNQNAENGAGGVYRSEDYGATWSRVLGTPNGNHQRCACDATGRYVCVVGSASLYTSKDYGATWKSFGFTQTRSVWVSRSGDYMWVGRFATSDNYLYSNDFGHFFEYGNSPVGSNYVGMANDCIACNNDGSIVMSGSISGLKINTFREFPNDVRQLTGSTNIQILEQGQGQYQVNWVAPSTSSSAGLRFYTGNLTSIVNFNIPTVNLTNSRIRARTILYVNTDFDFPVMRFNGVGDIASASNTNEQSFCRDYIFNSPSLAGNPNITSFYQDRSCIFYNSGMSGNSWVLIDFEIDLVRDAAGLANGSMICKGRTSFVDKPPNNPANFRAYNDFERTSDVTTISQISFARYAASINTILYASLNYEVIPLPTYTNI